MSNIIDPRELNECDKEQVQFIESIQNFGALLATDANGKICHAAVGDGFQLSPKALIGINIDDLFAGDARRIRQAVEGRSEPTTPLLIRNSKLSKWLTCIVHNQGDFRVYELEQVSPEPVDIPSVEFMREKRDTLENYLARIANHMRNVSDYDRVMIYKFAPDWHGEVVAESILPNVQSFQGHHFPASDIPIPARNLFIQNWVRMIADTNAPTVPIEASSSSKLPLDLTKSILRAPSKIHIQYLRNMNVGASLTLSLICDARLWGLIACHNTKPKYISAEERSIYSLIAKVVSSRLTALSIAEVVTATDRVAGFIKILRTRHSPDQLLQAITDHKDKLQSLVSCSGFIFANDTFVRAGSTPSNEDLKPLIAALNRSYSNLVQTNAIGQMFPSLTNLEPIAAGILAIRVANVWCIWTRHEMVRSEIWAGDPSKPFNLDSQLTPRASFDSWSQQVKGTSNHWQQHEIDSADRLRVILVDSLEGIPAPKVDAQDYLDLLRTSINRQASELQDQFQNIDLEGSLPD